MEYSKKQINSNRWLYPLKHVYPEYSEIFQMLSSPALWTLLRRHSSSQTGEEMELLDGNYAGTTGRQTRLLPLLATNI